MSSTKSNFLDKVLGAHQAAWMPKGSRPLWNGWRASGTSWRCFSKPSRTESLVVDARGIIVYFNQAVTRLLGIPGDGVEGQPVRKYLPQLDWAQLLEMDRKEGARVARHEIEVSYPEVRYLRLYAAPLERESAGAGRTGVDPERRHGKPGRRPLKPLKASGYTP